MNSLSMISFLLYYVYSFPQVNELSFSTTMSKCQFNKTVYSILKDTRLFDEDYAYFESQITSDKVIRLVDDDGDDA